jgi:hypothetical protein
VILYQGGSLLVPQQTCCNSGAMPPASAALPMPSSRGAWKLDVETENKLEAIFGKLVGQDETLDLNNNQDKENKDRKKKEERRKGFQQLSKLLFDHGLTLDDIRTKCETGKKMTYEQLKQTVEREREVTRKQQVLAQMNVQRTIAECISGGCPENPLKDMGMHQDIKVLCLKIAHSLEVVFRKYCEEQKIAENKLNNLSTNQTSGNIKFALTEAVFGKIEDYHQGLVEALGYPDPKLDVAIEHEHCRRADSHKKFNPGNYENVETTPFECESCSFARTND